MARLSRADRKRTNTRLSQAPQCFDAPIADTAPALEQVANVESKTLRTTRRQGKLTSDTINYTAEYAIIGHDLRRIACWGVLLMTCVIALSYSGLV